MTRLVLIGLAVVMALNFFDTNLSGLVGIGLFVLIGIAIWNRVYVRALVMALVGALFFGDDRTMFLLVAAGLGGLLVLRSRRGTVRRIKELRWLHTQASPAERALAKSIRKHWTDTMYYAKLTAFDRRRPALGWRAYLDEYRRREADRAKAEGDEAISTPPLLMLIEPIGLGLRLVIAPAPDQSPEDWENACSGLALQWAVPRVRVADTDYGLITLDVVMRDPLRETYPFVAPEPGSITAASEWLYGMAEDGREVRASPLKENHGGRQGTTGVGKSIATYGEIAHAVACPDVIVAGSDPTGLLLGDFMGPRHAPWQVVGLDDLEAHVALWARLVDVQRRRTEVLRDMRTDKFEAGDITAEMPLIVAYLEEYPDLHAAVKLYDRKLADQLDMHVSSLFANGRKVGIRLRLIAQRFDTSVLGNLGGFVRNNTSMRQTFRVESTEAVKMLHPAVTGDDQNEALSFDPGVCLFRSFEFNNVRVRVPYIDGYGAYRDAVERAAWYWISTDQSPEPVYTEYSPPEQTDDEPRPSFRKPRFGPDQEAS